MKKRPHHGPAERNRAYYGYVPDLMSTAFDILHERKDKATPEIELAQAVFAEVKIDLERGPGKVAHGDRWRDYNDARNWVLSDRADWPFAFRNLCGLFNLDESAARAALLATVPSGQGKRNLPSLRNDGHIRRTVATEMRARQSREWERRSAASQGIGARP